MWAALGCRYTRQYYKQNPPKSNNFLDHFFFLRKECCIGFKPKAIKRTRKPENTEAIEATEAGEKAVAAEPTNIVSAGGIVRKFSKRHESAMSRDALSEPVFLINLFS